MINLKTNDDDTNLQSIKVYKLVYLSCLARNGKICDRQPKSIEKFPYEISSMSFLIGINTINLGKMK